MDSSESGGDDSGHEREREQEQDEDEDEDVDEDPKAKLDGFDWSAFETRYHQAMADEDAAEKANEAELAELLKFFRIWAETTVTHERDRSYKRLKTRTHFVQQSEQTLAERREHYISVVKAFESALALLQ